MSSSFEELLAATEPDFPSRPRRNRKSAAIRSMCRETWLHPGQLIYPMFLHADADNVPLDSMPGQTRWSLSGLVGEVRRVAGLGIDKVVVFPKVDDSLKTPTGDEAGNDAGLIPEAIRRIKDACPDTCVVTDVGDAGVIASTHGAVVQPENQEQLANAWKTALERNQDVRSIQADESRISIIERYSLVEIARNTLALLTRIQ